MRRLLALPLILSLLAVSAVAVAAPPAHTGLGIALLDGPANLANDPRAHVYVIDHVQPGAAFTRHLRVTNDTGASAHISLYSDSAVIKNGAFVPQDGRTANELTSWMTVTPSGVDLAQGKSQVVTVRFNVPAGASGGERYGVVFAELPGHAVKGGFSVASRVGIRVYLSVNGGVAPRIDFSITTLTAGRADDGHPVVEATVMNTGGRALDMSGRLWLRNGPGGLSAGPFPVQLGTTLGIGQTEPVTVPLDKALPAGPWRAHLELQSDLVKRAAEATVTFPTEAGTNAAPVKAQAVPLTRDRHLLVPIAIGLITGLVVGIVLFLLWRRRRRDDDQEPSAPTSTGGAPRVPGQRADSDERVRR